MHNTDGAPKRIKFTAHGTQSENINVEIPLNQIVGIAGVSGSGKSSLALGVVYAEGSRRYLESLSTYTRRRMTGAAKAQVMKYCMCLQRWRCTRDRGYRGFAVPLVLEQSC